MDETQDSNYYVGPVKFGDDPTRILTEIFYQLYAGTSRTSGGGGGGGDASAANQLTQIAAEQAILARVAGTTTTTFTPVDAAVTTNGSVAAGKRYVSFIISSDFAGTINGVAYAGTTDAFKDYPILPLGAVYAAIPYTFSAGTLRMTSF